MVRFCGESAIYFADMWFTVWKTPVIADCNLEFLCAWRVDDDGSVPVSVGHVCSLLAK